jgi:N-methylhydantoinase A/oxoprolinase/acetone carboxylase beta subunit
VTDANLLLGRIDSEYFLGGRMALDTGHARRIARVLAAQLNLSELALVEGVVRIANANMVRAIRVVSVERGFDPRDFALLAFGGAGGLHACEMAEMLDIATVLIPEHAGVLSALGMLLADAAKDYSLTLLKRTAEATKEELHIRFAPLMERGLADLAHEGFTPADSRIECALDMRYRGQAYEITVPFKPHFEEHFHSAHRQKYGCANAARPTEIVHLRVKAIGRTAKPALPHIDVFARPLPESYAVRPARFRGRTMQTPVYRRETLAPGMSGQGPAIVAGAQSTSAIPPGFGFAIDSVGTLVAMRMKPQERKARVTAKEAHAD